MALAMAALLAIYAAWQLLDLAPTDRTLLGDAFFCPVGLAAIYGALGASKRCQDSPRLRSAWRWLALASASYLLGDVAQTVYELTSPEPYYPSVSDLFYLMFYPLMLWGLLRFPTSSRNRGEGVRMLLDLAVVAIAGSAVVIYLVIGPTAAQLASDPIQSAIAIAYPVGDMVLLAGLATLLLRRALPSSRLALQLLAAALTLFVAGDLMYSYIALHSSYRGGEPLDSLWMVAIALLAVAAAAQRPVDGVEEEVGSSQLQKLSRLPYVAVGVGFGLLLAAQSDNPLFPDKAITITAVLIAALVSARQFLAQRDLLNSQGQLSHQALHDSLTDLPNRVLALDRAQQMLARSRRQHTPVAALYLDLDHFKDVNDSFGHAAGDELLQIVAARLTTVVREGDTAARLGGDEFVILLEGSTLDAGPELVAERLLDVLRQPCDMGTTAGRRLSTTASIGIALGVYASADELLHDADLAMYESKASGGNRYTLFNSSMQRNSQRRLTMQMDLADAVEHQQLFLLYQPTFDLDSESVTGVEALIRWRHPTRGDVPPTEFIPIAEESGLVVPIGRWVLHEACTQASSWHRTGHAIHVAVNISAHQLDSGQLFKDVNDALKQSGLGPAALTLEVTETALMRDVDAAAECLQELKQLGIRIAIDDFGTGYSSLAYLRRLPADVLKIDRSFIDGIATSKASAALVHTLVQLGETLDIETLAEGIENEAQLQILQRERCDQGQGFLFSRPLDVDAVEQFLDAARPTVSSVPNH
jgi:diguanylate cyclase (GGDEF)-like protein